MSNLDFIYKRHSIRKFKNQDVPIEDIKEMIKAATYAPSGKNLQNWHFVVVKNKEKIEEMAKIVERKSDELASYATDEEMKKSFTKYRKYQTLFRNAPVVILIFAGPYPSTGLEILKAKGASSEEIHNLLRPSPGIQNIGAAIENLLLAAANMGYGGCWMTSPNFASKEIQDYIGFKKEGYFLAAITPIGVPEESELKSPPRKPIEEVMTIIE
ncbi:Nitroreductase [Caminicella sporogenes DSM 14501]|uniref:Nitroreductase n=1 Tax=Caminicella sporogenes DSM 14501 TaxID=1121266 RepID=A0A1M6MIF7_9FIRM|nr:nitroreductase family protein [Caminicella sporogenes]RKD27535.1 nitroreductase [Caminicella sporogenes]SHJ83309.1 Nitroreductase [Caminicella sporogenes DSM 14501]